MKTIGKYSIGLGDRFGHQGGAQLKAIIEAGKKGIEITPVWNKSNREHVTIGTEPGDVRKEADMVTKKLGFTRPYFVDADHINIDNVGRFITASDFFTIDVASYIGKKAQEDEINEFLGKASSYTGELKVEGIAKPFSITRPYLKSLTEKYLFASKMAGEIYRKIEGAKGMGNFITEISMDEVPEPQTPAELFFILQMLSLENIPVQTIAPKFSGRFNKGVDYAGDPELFANEFESDILVIEKAVKEFQLPGNLKMSVHSGSDKFAIYPHIGKLVKKHEEGIHLKTAGTTWLEEVTGLAQSGGKALTFVKEIYYGSLDKIEELCAPYADVIDINRSSLPSKDEVSGWTSTRFADSIRHIPGNKSYNPNMRQLIHVAYKLAAHRMDEFYTLLDQNEKTVSDCVYENIYNRHICRLFDIN
jgi:tagaturonate epimerase